MSRTTEENKEELKEKLTYLGLNLEKIPKVLNEFKPFSFRPSKSYDDTSYKVYQYIPVNDIQILLTPTDRLTDLNQKYKLSAPIGAYLDSKSENNLEKFACFLVMLNDMNINNIEAIEKEQQKIKEILPYEVKYPNNYIWQIYYSDISNQYFMLVPTNETNNNAFFYLLKKQIETSKSHKKEYIFAPITHQEYSGKYLMQSQITDLENYLWYFTKEWPNIFEIYDLKGNMSIKIVGKTKVYSDIKSNYVITLETKEKAIEWYKLVKALFILATGLPADYIFDTSISEKGELEFWYEKVKMEYSSLPAFIKEQVEQKRSSIILQDKKIEESKEGLQDLKKVTEKQTEEFLNKQRQIATFLACKKSFFGKIRYYFGNRKKHLSSIEGYKLKNRKTRQKEDINQEEIVEEVKENYNIEDLIEVCTKLDERVKELKSIEMDKKALELKQINLERKIKNANIYLNEIELHKKSIFEFWKFTNKDELPSLNEGEEDENNEKEKIGKSFNYEEDIEDLGKQMDEIQRRKLSKNETDSIFAVKHALSSSQILNKTKGEDLTKEQKGKLKEQLDELKDEYEKNKEVIQIKDFDIFGGISDDQTKVKMLHNEKHREIEKDKYKVLNITPSTKLELYIDNLRNCLKLVHEALLKVNTPFEMPAYIAKIINESELSGEALEKDNLNIANLNATEELYKMADIIKENETLDFYTLVLPKDSQAIYCTNITHFDNSNQTLPLGMDVSTNILIDLEKYKLDKKEEKDFRVNYQIDEYTNKVIKVHGVKYRISKNI